ncbi:MAG: VOC family protein [Lentisphaeria bacterium]
MIKRFAHVCLAAADLAATERFYCGGLGLKKTFDFIRDGRVIGFYLELCPGEYVEVFQREESAALVTGPILHFCLEVDDLEPVGRRLAEHGYDVTPKTLGADHSWQMWTTAPDGVKIEFHQYTGRSCQRTHENCIVS